VSDGLPASHMAVPRLLGEHRPSVARIRRLMARRVSHGQKFVNGPPISKRGRRIDTGRRCEACSARSPPGNLALGTSQPCVQR
jgi:hypothetical protein